jgi:glycosyltransferase involved in cell wall biosynthesis
MIQFSIVIPTYNSRKTIISTLNSCLNQTYQNFEILIIDDCSSDDTVEVVKSNFSQKNIQIYELDQNNGVAFARNFGWNLSNGKFVAFLDSDDVWSKYKLEAVNYFIDRFNYKIIGHFHTDNEMFLNNDFDGNPKFFEISTLNLLFKNYFNTSCLVIDNNLKVRFNQKFRYTEDHDLLLRLSVNNSIALICFNYTLLNRPQLTSGGLSGNKIMMRIGEIKMYFNFCTSNLFYTPLLPFLFIYSLSKYLIKYIK